MTKTLIEQAVELQAQLESSRSLMLAVLALSWVWADDRCQHGAYLWRWWHCVIHR